MLEAIGQHLIDVTKFLHLLSTEEPDEEAEVEAGAEDGTDVDNSDTEYITHRPSDTANRQEQLRQSRTESRIDQDLERMSKQIRQYRQTTSLVNSQAHLATISEEAGHRGDHGGGGEDEFELKDLTRVVSKVSIDKRLRK